MRYSRSETPGAARIVLVNPDPYLLRLFVLEHPGVVFESATTLAELQAALAEHADLVVVDHEDPLLAQVLIHDADPKTVATAPAGARIRPEFEAVLHRPYTARDVRRIGLGLLPGPQGSADFAPSGRPAEGDLPAAMARWQEPAGPVGLARALREHCRDLAAVTRSAIRVEAHPVPRLAADREQGLFALVCDVVDQALRSRGTERIDVGLSASADTVLVLVTNRGGDTSRLNHPAGGLGLPYLRAQAAALAATVDLLAGCGSGYRVSVTCPLEVEVGA